MREKQNFRDKIRRMRYFSCAIELIQNSRSEPTSKENPNRCSEVLHRFTGTTKDNNFFFLQIKEDKRTGNKWLISVFPSDKQTNKKRPSANLWYMNHGQKPFSIVRIAYLKIVSRPKIFLRAI